jgi:hypothetical protein
MGHYDSCREADEELALAKDGESLKALVAVINNRDAGRLKRALWGVLREAKNLQGTRDQHEVVEAHESVIDKITSRRL